MPGLDVRAGQTVAGRYRVEELIGAGASGVVLSARTLHLRQRVALKIFASYGDGQEELLHKRLGKARLACKLQGMHVARIVDIGTTAEAMPYVATEWLEGKTLEAELIARERIPASEAARWILEACEGLAEAHALGLVHGDLKPRNILLAEPTRAPARRLTAAGVDEPAVEVDARVLKILDFGSTSPLDAMGDESASAFFGSPAFLAPEQIRGMDVDARADIWALGVLLYNAVSGALPFEADTVSGMLVAVACDAPALLTDAPYGLTRLVHRCLDKDPAKRPQDVAKLATELAPFAGANGLRLSERVRAELQKPREQPPLRETSAAGSTPPVSIPRVPPLPSAQTTTPSQQAVAQRRRTRARVTTLALLGAGGLAIASFVTAAGSALRTPPVGDTHASSEPVLARPGAEYLSTPAADLAATEIPGALSDEPTTSFAPTTTHPMTPTPLAAIATRLATAAAPVVLPAPTPAPIRYPLPPGLPTSRDGL